MAKEHKIVYGVSKHHYFFQLQDWDTIIETSRNCHQKGVERQVTQEIKTNLKANWFL